MSWLSGVSTRHCEEKYPGYRTGLERAGWLAKDFPATDVGLQVKSNVIYHLLSAYLLCQGSFPNALCTLSLIYLMQSVLLQFS